MVNTECLKPRKQQNLKKRSCMLNNKIQQDYYDKEKLLFVSIRDQS